MSKYNFTESEREMLKVVKLNKDKSAEIEQQMKALSKSWESDLKSHEEFLNKAEQRLGIAYTKHDSEVKTFEHESEYTKPIEWDVLVAEANQKYSKDIDFEELLSKEEILNVYKYVDEIDAEFERRTGLQKRDIAFLAIAIGLQCVRQYIIEPWLKGRRQGSKLNDEKGEKKNADSGWYYVRTENILTNRVPFDAQNYNHTNDSTINGFLKGAKDHRYVTLGHDPVLGWIFGTANILTSTITRYDMKSAHVKNDPISKKNYIHSKANTWKIFEAVWDRWNSGFSDGKVAIALAVVREAKHLYSDINTKDSLPIPGVMTLSPTQAEKLAEYGIDMAGVATGSVLASMINWLIAVIHRLYYDENMDNEQYYEVRTRKIILYSNIIASTSNAIACCLTKNVNLLDVGGGLVTITRLITDVRFICKVKDEFIENKINENFEGIKEEVNALYEARFS